MLLRMKPTHILHAKQFDRAQLEQLFTVAEEMEIRDKQSSLSRFLSGKMLATLFYEPSTRTRFSFEAAFQKLGGTILSTENAGLSSSAAKGETLEDVVRVVGQYVDAIIIRHPQEGAIQAASEYSPVPILNAGDGAGEHPTQAMLDLFTMKKECGQIDGLNILFLGDLRYGRTVHSLLQLLSLYQNIHVTLVSPPELSLPQELEALITKRMTVQKAASPERFMEKADVIYATRIQKERVTDPAMYERCKDSYRVDASFLNLLKPSARILHPLPRVNEVDSCCDEDDRAAYFRQVKNGLYLRMALFSSLFEERAARAAL